MLEKFLKSSISIILIIIPISFFIVADSMVFPFITGKNFIFRSLIELALILYATLLYVNKDYFIKNTKIFYSYLLFILALLISNIFGSNPYSSFFSGFERMEGYITHIHLLAYFIMLVGIFKTREEWRRVFGFLFVISIPIMIFGIAQLLGQKSFYNTINTELFNNFVSVMNSMFPTGQGNGLRIDSTFGNSAYSAIYFLIISLLASLYAFRDNNWIINNKQKVGNFFLDILSIVSFALLSIIIITSKYANLIFIQILKNENLASFYSFFVYILYVVLLILGYYIVNRIYLQKVSSYFYALLSFISGYLLYYTQTRGAYIALFVAMLFILFGLYRKSKEINNKWLRDLIKIKFYGLIFCAIFLVGFLKLYGDTDSVKKNIFLNRISTINLNVFNPFQIYYSIHNDTYSQMVGRFGETTLASRVMNIGMAMNFNTSNIKNFLIGNGQENYVYIFSKYHDSRMFAQEAWFDRAHNVLFDWLTAGGVIGFVAYLSIFVISISSIIKNTKVNLFERYFIGGALLGYFIHNMFVFDNITSYILFIILIAYIASQDENNVINISNTKYKNYIFVLLDKIINNTKRIVSNCNYIVKRIILSLFAIIIIVVFYKTVLLASFKASLSIDYVRAVESYVADPVGSNSKTGVTNYNNLMNYIRHVSLDNTFGLLDVFNIVLSYLPSIANLDAKGNEEILNQKKAIFEKINTDLIPLLVAYYGNEKTYTAIASFYDNIGYGDIAATYFEQAEKIGGKKPLTKSQYAISLAKHNHLDMAVIKALEAYNLNRENTYALNVLESIKALLESRNAEMNQKSLEQNIKIENVKIDNIKK